MSRGNFGPSDQRERFAVCILQEVSSLQTFSHHQIHRKWWNFKYSILSQVQSCVSVIDIREAEVKDMTLELRAERQNDSKVQEKYFQTEYCVYLQFQGGFHAEMLLKNFCSTERQVQRIPNVPICWFLWKFAVWKIWDDFVCSSTKVD